MVASSGNVYLLVYLSARYTSESAEYVSKKFVISGLH